MTLTNTQMHSNKCTNNVHLCQMQLGQMLIHFFSMNEDLVLLSNNDIFGPGSVGFWRSTIDDLRAIGRRDRKVVWEKYFSERNRSPLSYSTWSSSTWSEGGECCKRLYFSYMLCFPCFLFVFLSNLSICHLFSPLFHLTTKMLNACLAFIFPLFYLHLRLSFVLVFTIFLLPICSYASRL